MSTQAMLTQKNIRKTNNKNPPPLPPSVKPLVTLARSHFECVVDLVLVFQARPRLESEIFELPPRRQGRAVLPLAFMQLLGWG